MEENKNEIANINFELVESEEEKKSLIENLDKFEIFSFENLGLPNVSDSIVKSVYEILKNNILSNQTSQLLKCSAPLNELMRYKDGSYGGAIINQTSKRIEAQAHFTPASNVTKFISPFVILQIASIALGQYFMFKIDSKLENILKYIKDISTKIEYEKMASMKTVISEIVYIKNKKTMTENDINNLTELKKRTKDVLFYYEQKIWSINEKKISYGNKQRYMERIYEMLKPIGELDLDYNMYKLSSEILIYIHILLFYSFMNTSDTEDANQMLNEIKKSDYIFRYKISKKLKSVFNKMLEILNDIQKNKNHIPDKIELAFDIAYLPVATPLAKIIIKKVKNSEDPAKLLIEEYEKKLKFLRYNKTDISKAAEKIVSEMEKARNCYYFELDGKKYNIIEK